MDLSGCKQIRYIKLGSRGSKVDQACIARKIVYIGFGTVDNELYRLASMGQWDAFKALYLERDLNGTEQARKQRATSATNQVKAFFEAGSETLWITFYGGLLHYGAFSNQSLPNEEPELGGRIRTLKSGWYCEDANGKELKVENLSGNLTKVQGFQGTSFSLSNEQSSYLITRLSGKVPDYIVKIDDAREKMVSAIKSAIKTLQPKDFELLVEIIFSRSWRRVGKAGGAVKFTDITFEDPLNPDRMIAVQVKSETTLQEIKKYCKDEQFNRYEKFYFVFHTPDQAELLEGFETQESLEIIDCNRLASLVVDSGLIHWLKEKTS